MSLVAAGILFHPVPGDPPFSDEASLQGAEAFASTGWVVAHVLGRLGFILKALGFLGVREALRATPVVRLSFQALVVDWMGRA